MFLPRSLPLVVVAIGSLFADESLEHFEMKVRPLLASNCYSCHRQTAMGGLRLDSREAILKGGASGPAAVSGSPDASLLLKAVSHSHEKLRMPPQGKLKPEEIQAISDWIRDGLSWPTEAPAATPPAGKGEYVITTEQRAFWSFQPVREPKPPAVRNKAWVKSFIDNFVVARLEREGLRPAPAADKRTLIRRATWDLHGLPPTPQEVDAFLTDKSPEAFAKVVDRLLASPRYGERWGRYWLDVARYSDDRLNSTQDSPYPNSFRYRNWVIDAFNRDVPYNVFVKAQLAGDQLPSSDPLEYKPALGFYALSPEMQDERVDATTRGFLGLTVACAQCHDHKFDPIPTVDYYSLQGVFSSTKLDETPLAPQAEVDHWQALKKKADKADQVLKAFYDAQSAQLGEILAARTADFLLAARGLSDGKDLDAETLERWKKYLADERKDHPFLKKWRELAQRNAPPDEFKTAALELQQLIQSVIDEKKEVDEKNKITLGSDPQRRDLVNAALSSLERDRYVLWRELFDRSGEDSGGVRKTPDGVLYYGRGKIERFLHGEWKAHLTKLQADAAAAKKALPKQYPFLQTIADSAKPADVKVQIRGDRNNLGEVAPRRFLAILSSSERKPFAKGSGRLELAEAIADPANPLTSRVMVNRIWQYHFGRGIVDTPSNFGMLGERPTHPELLDWLASHFVKSRFSMKAMHRLIMLSATYALSAQNVETNLAKDADNRLLWRANRRRLDVEALRDGMLFAAGRLDTEPGDGAMKLDDPANRKRTVYGFISRRKIDGVLALFDFPNPNSASESRMSTNVPPQRLFLMNSPFVAEQAEALAARFTGDDAARIGEMYRAVYGRMPDAAERKLGLEYVAKGGWASYSRVLLGSNEFLFVD